MFSYWYLLTGLLLLITGLAWESWRHHRNLKKIPYRIHVNGTRGKSSVARLIAAGLRAGGIATCAKTTGTTASFIDLDGNEQPIFRLGHTNIVEQIKVVRRAAKRGAQALVVECMALQPLLQSVCELRLIKSTHGALTNARPDHLDVMGPTAEDVAYALAGTVPVKGHFFTSEQHLLGTFQMASKDRSSTCIPIDPTMISSISDSEIQSFCYEEYKENVALALAVCQALGVKRDTALQGMWQAKPDPGAMASYTKNHQNHELIFVNGFAANDPVSTGMLWHKMLDRYADIDDKILLINCRADRQQRSADLAKAMMDWKLPDRCLVIGAQTQVFASYVKTILPDNKLILGENWSIKQLLPAIIRAPVKQHLIVGVGNIYGMGFELINYFRDPL